MSIYCDPLANICISAEAWAAWAGAGFTSLAIAASLFVFGRQLRAQERLHQEQLIAQQALLKNELVEQARQRAGAERAFEVLQLNRALLAITGYLNAFRDQSATYKAVTLGEDKHYRFPSNRTRWLIPMDQDSLAFLVLRGSQSLLNEMSAIHATALQWEQMVNDFSEAVRAINPVLERAFTAQQGRALDRGTIVSAIGSGKDLELSRRVAHLEGFTEHLVQWVAASEQSIRSEILRLYPDAVLPDQEAGWVSAEVAS